MLGAASAREDLEPRVAELRVQLDDESAALGAAEDRAAGAEADAATASAERDATATLLAETATQRDLAISERDAAIAEAARMSSLYEQAYAGGLTVQTQRNQLAGQISTLNQSHTALGTAYEQLVEAANAQDAKRVAEYNVLVDRANRDQAALKSLLSMCHADVRALINALGGLDVARQAALDGDQATYAAAMAFVAAASDEYQAACNPQ